MPCPCEFFRAISEKGDALSLIRTLPAVIITLSVFKIKACALDSYSSPKVNLEHAQGRVGHVCNNKSAPRHCPADWLFQRLFYTLANPVRRSRPLWPSCTVQAATIGVSEDTFSAIVALDMGFFVSEIPPRINFGWKVGRVSTQ